jgi:monothiol glutaredoxin
MLSRCNCTPILTILFCSIHHTRLSSFFPSLSFSPRHQASQILNSFNIDYHTVDVLSDDAIRQGIKEYSQWPTIPQLYVCGEFIGGSDIMIEMYQTGELGEMIEKVRTKGLLAASQPG